MNQQLENLITCVVCLEIKENSKGCKQCNAVVCQKCIDDLESKGNKECAKCRAGEWKTQNLVLQNMIDIYMKENEKQLKKKQKEQEAIKKSQERLKQKKQFWFCTECGGKNQRKDDQNQCFQCGEDKIESDSLDESEKQENANKDKVLKEFISLPGGDWQCTNCNSKNGKNRWSCYKCEMKKENDWTCEKCKAINYCIRWSCHNCDEKRDNDWTCEECDTVNWFSRTSCRQCFASK